MDSIITMELLEDVEATLRRGAETRSSPAACTEYVRRVLPKWRDEVLPPKTPEVQATIERLIREYRNVRFYPDVPAHPFQALRPHHP